MASMSLSSSSSSAEATELMSRCSAGSVISITSNSSMRYEGVVDSVHLQDELICLSNVRSFGTESRRKDCALVLPDDRVFNNVQFRVSDIKEWQVLSASPAVQLSALSQDPAIIQCRPLHPTLGGSAHHIKRSQEDGCDPNMGSKLTIEENLPSASPLQALTSFSASNLSTNYWKQPMQGGSGILGGMACVRPHYSLDMQPTSAEYIRKRPTQRSSDNMSLNHTFSINSQVPLTSSTPFQTGSPYISQSLDLSPITLSSCNLSPDVIPTIVAPEKFPSLSLSRDCNNRIPSLSTTLAKTSSSSLKSASQTTTVSSSLLSSEKMNKGRVHDNMQVAGQPERNIANSHTFQRRQPRKICSFGRTNKVSQLPTNSLDEFSARSVNVESDKAGVYNQSSKTVHVLRKQRGTTCSIYVPKSEKVSDRAVHAHEDIFESPVPPESESAKRNSTIPDLQKMDAASSGGSMADRSSGRLPKLSGAGSGAARGKTGRSRAESHVT